MAALINHSNFTFTADELRSYSELIVKKLTEVPELNAFHTFETGIRNDRRIGLTDGSFGLLGKAAQDCGTRTPDTKLLGTEQKTWQPKRAEVYLRECWNDLDSTMGRLARKLGNDVYDLTGTDYMTFLLSILEPDLLRMIFRMAWFNDTAAALVTASPAGTLTAGTDTTYFTLYDGFFAQLADIISADSDRQTSLNAYNGQATYALQDSTLTNQLAYEALLQLIDDAPPALRSQADRAIICTGSIGRKAMRYIQAQGLPYDIKLAIDGLTLTSIDGTSLYIVEWWDEFIRTYYDDGSAYYLPHRAVFTKKSNLMVGMEGNGLFESFDVYHDKTTKYTYIEAVDAFDAKIIEDEMVQYAV